MAQEIGYQHGIVAGMNGLRDLDPSKTLLKKSGGKWPSIDTLADIPLDQWKAWDKMERAFTILVYDHDDAMSSSGGGTPPPDPTPPDPHPPEPTGFIGVAARATNQEGGANVQYCMRDPRTGQLWPGVQDLGGDNYRDESGATYHEALQTSGVRDESYVVAGLPGSRGMDGRSPCKCLEDAGFPGDPTKNTGAWHI